MRTENTKLETEELSVKENTQNEPDHRFLMSTSISVDLKWCR